MSRKAILLLVIAAASAVNGKPQNVTAISDGWRFNKADTNGAEAAGFDDSSWMVVSLPHTWNDKDTLRGGNYYRGPGWYRLKLAIPESDFANAAPDRKGCVFKWPDVRLKEGLNQIEAIATRDGKTYTDRCEWTLTTRN